MKICYNLHCCQIVYFTVIARMLTLFLISYIIKSFLSVYLSVLYALAFAKCRLELENNYP